MEITRRQFAGHLVRGAAVVTLALGTIELSGCNAITDIENWIPTGEAAVNAILAVLTANNIPVSIGISTIVGLIETGLNDLLAAAKEYQSTTPPPVGTLAKIQTILQDISDNFSNFTGQLSGTAAKILAVVTSLAQVVISTIAGFVSSLPTSGNTRIVVAARLNGQAVQAVHRTRRAFKKAINAELDAAKKQGVNVPSQAYMHISLLERF